MRQYFLYIAIIVIALSSCGDDDAPMPERTGTITTVTYSVKDSSSGPPVFDWYYGSYDITVQTDSELPDSVVITNISEIRGDLSGNINAVDSFFLPWQETNIANEEASANGYFSNDTIYFGFENTNSFSEVFYGRGQGHAIDTVTTTYMVTE